MNFFLDFFPYQGVTSKNKMVAGTSKVPTHPVLFMTDWLVDICDCRFAFLFEHYIFWILFDLKFFLTNRTGFTPLIQK